MSNPDLPGVRRSPAAGNGDGPIRILLADDHAQMLDKVRALLAGEFAVVGAVDNGDDAVSAAARLEPDVVVLDIAMPGISGLEAARRLKLAASPARVIFLTMHHEPEFLDAAWEAGALGYVRKARLASDLVPAIRAAVDGRRFVSASPDLRLR